MNKKTVWPEDFGQFWDSGISQINKRFSSRTCFPQVSHLQWFYELGCTAIGVTGQYLRFGHCFGVLDSMTEESCCLT